MRTELIRDKLIFGALAGVVADLALNIPEFILWRLKLLPHPLFHYAGSLFMSVDMLHNAYLGEWMGFLASKVYGAFLGVVFIYLLVFTGRRYFITKGVIYGAFIWLVSYCGLAALPVVKLSVHPRTPLEVFIFFFLHLLFGLVLGVMARSYARHPKAPV